MNKKYKIVPKYCDNGHSQFQVVEVSPEFPDLVPDPDDLNFYENDEYCVETPLSTFFAEDGAKEYIDKLIKHNKKKEEFEKNNPPYFYP